MNYELKAAVRDEGIVLDLLSAPAKERRDKLDAIRCI